MFISFFFCASVYVFRHRQSVSQSASESPIILNYNRNYEMYNSNFIPLCNCSPRSPFSLSAIPAWSLDFRRGTAFSYSKHTFRIFSQHPFINFFFFILRFFCFPSQDVLLFILFSFLFFVYVARILSQSFSFNSTPHSASHPLRYKKKSYFSKWTRKISY